MVTADSQCPHMVNLFSITAAWSQITLLGCIMSAWGNWGSPFGFILSKCGNEPASSLLVRHAVNIYNEISRNKVLTRTSEDTKRHTQNVSQLSVVICVPVFPFSCGHVCRSLTVSPRCCWCVVCSRISALACDPKNPSPTIFSAVCSGPPGFFPFSLCPSVSHNLFCS